MQRHVRKLRGVYRDRRDALVGALERELAGALTVSPPAGGMALWARVRATWAVKAIRVARRDRGQEAVTGFSGYFDFLAKTAARARLEAQGKVVLVGGNLPTQEPVAPGSTAAQAVPSLPLSQALRSTPLLPLGGVTRGGGSGVLSTT